MAKISPKKESDKPRNPLATSFEKINEDLAPAINGLKNLDFSRFTKALGSLSVGSFAEIEAQAYGDEVQINPDLYKIISKPDPEPFPPHIMQQLQDLQAKLRGYDNEDSPAATTQPVEDLPQTFEELFHRPDEDLPKLTALLQGFGLLNSDGKWLGSDTGKGRGKLMLVIDALNKRSIIQYHSDEITGKLICEHYGTRLGTRSYHNRPTDPEGLKDAVKGLFRPE